MRTARIAITLSTALAVAVPSVAPALAEARLRAGDRSGQPGPAEARPGQIRLAQAGDLRAASITRDDYEACKARDEADFRRAVEAITLDALEKGLKGFDFKGAVGDEWRRADLDRTMGEEVDKAIEHIRATTGFGEQVSSLFSKETATRLAADAAERVYRSDAVKAGIEKLAIGVGRQIGRRLELATADASEPAARCMAAFLGPRYGSTIAGVVSGDAARDFAVDPSKGAAEVTPARAALEGSEAIAGAVVLIVRRQLANLASRVGQRLVGVVLSRIVATIATGIGILLIGKDLWELRQGALPIIASEMKSSSTRDKVQEALGGAIAEQIAEHLKEIAAKSSERVVEVWHDFRRAHAKVTELAARDEAFRRFVDSVSAKNLARLDEIVGLVLASEGEAGVLKRLADGTLHNAVERLPAAALDIARATRSLVSALDWAALAGDRLPEVVAADLYRRNPPAEFSRTSLARLLGLGDATATDRLARLPGSVREPLLELADKELAGLARALDVAELASLSGYLTGLDKVAGKRLLVSVAAAPSRMQIIAPDAVRRAVLASRDQAAAVGILLRGDTLFDFALFADDARAVWGGAVDWRVLWTRYPMALAGFAGLALIVLLAFWRALFGRHPRPPAGRPPAAAAPPPAAA